MRKINLFMLIFFLVLTCKPRSSTDDVLVIKKQKGQDILIIDEDETPPDSIPIPPDSIPPEPEPEPPKHYDLTACASGCDYTRINDAAAVAQPGDTIGIGDGVYRETITPKVNNLTFINIEGQTPKISGFNIVPGPWAVHSGNIYKTSITLPVNGFNTSTSGSPYPGNTNIFANQILRNGEMMFEARFPNIPSFTELMKWQSYRQYNYEQGFKASSLTDGALPTSPPALKGGTIVSNGWYDTFASTITGHDNNGSGGVERVTYSPAIRDDSDPGQYMREAYYITGRLGLLDIEKEWHYENGTLYFWQPDGGTPSGTIEYKARNWGFDIRGRSGIKIIGLTFTGVDPVIGDAASTGAVVQKTKATYNNHVVRHDYWRWNGVQVGMAYQLGTKLLGANSVFKDNEWSRAASIMLWLGPSVTVENNLIFDSGYAGNSGGAISLWANDGGQKIIRNTIYNQGRGAIFFGYVERGSHTNMEISYNHFYTYGTINGDGGASYSGNQTILTGLDYHHNWIHGNASRQTPGKGGLNGGIYFDQASGGGTVHHNVVWDNSTGDFYHQQKYNGVTSNLINVYNNTFASTLPYGGNEHSYKTPDNNPLDIQRNNIYRRKILINWESGNYGNNQNYLLPNVDPLFVGTGGDGLAYRVQSNSPAVNKGQTIEGITTGAVGAPDIGAYENGGEEWVPGYKSAARPSDGTVNDDAWTYSGTWTEKNNAPASMINSDIRYTLELGAYAVHQFSKNTATFYYEACDNHAMARLEILNSSGAVIAKHDVNTFKETGSGTCDAPAQLSYTFNNLAAGAKTAKFTFLTADLSQSPPRNSIALDGGKFFDTPIQYKQPNYVLIVVLLIIVIVLLVEIIAYILAKRKRE